MKVHDFFQNNGISWDIEKYENPNRFYIIIKYDTIPVRLMLRYHAAIAFGEGETINSAWLNLIEKIGVNRLRIKGWNSKDEYVDFTIKAKNELEL